MSTGWSSTRTTARWTRHAPPSGAGRSERRRRQKLRRRRTLRCRRKRHERAIPTRRGHRRHLHRCRPALGGERRDPDREGPLDALGPFSGFPRRGRAHPPRCRHRPQRHLLPGARHHRRHQLDHRRQDPAHRVHHHRGLPRHARDRPPGAADALRCPLREAAPAGAAQPLPSRSPSGSTRAVACCNPWTRRGSTRSRGRSPSATSSRSRSVSCTAT